MELTVLGREGGFPSAGGACSGYLVDDGETRVLMDLGCGTLPRLRTLAAPDTLDALLLSHLHFDHISDALVLRYALEKDLESGARSRALPVYLPDTPPECRALFDGTKAFAPQSIRDGMEVAIGSIRVRFFAVRHPVETYGMRLTGADGHALAYTADTGLFSGLSGEVRGADALLADTAFFAARGAGEGAPHMTAAQASQLAKEAGVGRLYCTHLPGGEEAARKIAAEIDFTPGFVVKEQGRYTV